MSGNRLKENQFNVYVSFQSFPFLIILYVPFCSLVLNEGVILGQERNPATLYDPRIIQMPLDTLYDRFRHIPLESYYPLLHTNSEIIAKSNPPLEDAKGLPLVIREKNPEYQFHRVILFRRLLHVIS